MQTTDDGEYVPSKELEKGFKIPKKRKLQENGETMGQSPNQVLEGTYYNAPQVTAVTAATPFLWCRDGQGYAAQTAQVAAAPEWAALLTQQREKPKTYSNHILRETIPDCFDESLPHEMRSMFQPLYCKLCTAQLSSNSVARMHYKSKNHEKKIRKWLTDYSERTGEPLHKRARAEKPPAVAAPKGAATPGDPDATNPMYFYCEVCDLALTGKLHAESHYMGKNHRKATLGIKNPAGKGYFDPAKNKWIRQSKNSAFNPVGDNDGFGSDFRKTPAEESPSTSAAVCVKCQTAPCSCSQNAKFRCDICNVITTCQEQLESHYSGQKHRKKMKQHGIDFIAANCGTMVMSPVAAVSSPFDDSFAIGPADLVSSPPQPVTVLDCSSFRTPSGQFYCQICNSTSNSEVQFRQHLQSKVHLKKAAGQKQQQRS